MRILLIAGLSCVLVNSTSSAGFDLIKWAQAHPRLVSVGKETFAGLAGGLAQGSAEGKEGKELGKSALASGLNNFVQESLRQGIDELRGVSAPRAQIAMDRLKAGIDSKTTQEEYNMMLAAINLRMAEYEAEMRDQEYRLSELESRSRSNSQKIQDLKSQSMNQQRDIRFLKKQQEADREAFEQAVERIDMDLAKIRVRQTELEDELVNEVVERKLEDQYIYGQLDLQAAQIREIQSYLAPKTAGETATQLAAHGAMSLLKEGDPVEAARILQLAIAYDRRARKHVDPSMRYYLAVAYRRMGETVRADEVLSEAVVAERFRRTDQWYARLLEKFHGDDRFWVEQRRREARFGVRSPRNVILTGED